MSRQQYQAAETTCSEWLFFLLLVVALLLMFSTGIWLAFTAVRQLIQR